MAVREGVAAPGTTLVGAKADREPGRTDMVLGRGTVTLGTRGNGFTADNEAPCWPAPSPVRDPRDRDCVGICAGWLATTTERLLVRPEGSAGIEPGIRRLEIPGFSTAPISSMETDEALWIARTLGPESDSRASTETSALS